MKQKAQSLMRQGQFFGFLGVLGFSLTLPATRVAVTSIDATILGLGRALVAAVFAGIVLRVTRKPWPNRRQCKSLLWVAVGVVVGFPFFSAWAMQYVPASHGAVVLGVLPLVTALLGRMRSHERPSPLFWLSSVAGSLVVVIFALRAGGGSFHIADLALLAAIVFAAVGYAEGGHLAREMGGWQVICWALLMAAPVLLFPVGFALWRHGFSPTPVAWLGFSYVSIFSMFLCFFAWYHGLAVGGIAHVSQLQLLQPFLTLGFSVLLLQEEVGLTALVAAGFVTLSLLVSRRAAVAYKLSKNG
ncbi:Permease of the drug/metabolite transporter (DMT) superfamily [hydrothermal vent metagenome]|uniref:Permease of the drug/metabolite transporter (DMT) superfamily n=1 Tax=hydrothermal vent metagenome TaxID=652676 RepID=A0A3B1DTS6_9ZZZZ